MVMSKRTLLPNSPSTHADHVRAYSWRSETADGFTECELIYDATGRLLGVDYRPAPSAVKASLHRRIQR